MLRRLDDALQRWVSAGVLDAVAAGRIRQYEARRELSRLSWRVLVALIFGTLLIAAGIAFVVAAHWDGLSPFSRFIVVMVTLIAIHLAATLVRNRFDRLAIALHGVGTLAAGGAIALVEQIFNIHEHWPAGILLWALCALAGWALLGDEVQQTIALLLLPTWIVCEWIARTDGYRGSELMAIRMIVVIATVYLTAFLGSRRKLVAGILFAVGAVSLTVKVVGVTFFEILDSPFRGLLSFYVWSDWATKPHMPIRLVVFGWSMIALVLLSPWRIKREAWVPAAIVLLASIVLPHCYVVRYVTDYYGNGTWYTVPSMIGFLLVAALACFLAGWGVRERSRALINYSAAALVLTILWSYYSSVTDKINMGKFNRSHSLIELGVLLLGCGWLEKLRRRLVSQVKREGRHDVS